MRKSTVLVLLLLAATSQLFAQNRTVTGKITDDRGLPVVNASVLAKGTTIGVTSNTEGLFTISIPVATQAILVSYVGYTSKEIPLTSETNYTITLSASNRTDMDEVVVVAYGTQRKGAITSSVSQIGSRELENRPITNVLTAIAGVAAGVTGSSSNGQPGSSPALRIRGFGSLNASNTPLYVVDGVPYDYDISNINPDDIDNVSLLKDAAASALYGSRAANGVVQITTKRGKKERNQIQASITQGVITRGLPEYKRVDAFQYYPLMWEAYRNSLVYPASATTAPLPLDTANKIASGLMPRNAANQQVYGGRIYSDIFTLLGYNPFNVAEREIVGVNGQLNPNAALKYADDLNWLDDIQRNGIRGDYTLNFSGGGNRSDYFLSLGHTREDGYVKNSDYRRYSARINLNTQPLSWFKTGLNLAGIVTEAKQGASDNASTGLVNPFYTNRIIGPIYPVYVHEPTTGEYVLDASGSRQYDLGNLGALGGLYLNRPQLAGRHAIYETILNENVLHRNVLNSRVFGEISFLKNFRFTANISADVSNSLRSQAENPIVGDGAPSGRSRRNAYDNLTMTINQLLNYNRNFGSHAVEALVGHETYSGIYKSLTNLKTGQVLQGVTELVNYTTISSLTSYIDKDKIESYLSRLNYSYDNKYFFMGSIRRDGSSRFAPDYRWGTFWSVGAAWRMDRESFFSNLDWLNALKLRAAYGTVGNNRILATNAVDDNYYAYQSFYNLGSNNGPAPGAAVATTGGNDRLLWEINKQFDIALEFGAFKNRLNGTVEYFDRKSEDLLFRVEPPVSSGFLAVNQNVGAMVNKGIEVSINGDILRNKNLTWNVGLNWTSYKNQITRMPESLPELETSFFKWKEGVSRYEFWVREYMGVDPADGAALYRANTWVAATSRINAKGDTLTTDQNNARYHYAGNSIPDFFGGLNSSINYKGFGIAFQFNYSVGGLFYDAGYAQLMHSGTYGIAMHEDIQNRWQKPGDITNVPRLDAGRNAAFAAPSDRWLTDATWLTLQNVNISYTIPTSFISKAKIQNARIFVAGENLYMWTKRTGMNPIQTGNTPAGDLNGVGSNVYVPSRTITAGVNITL